MEAEKYQYIEEEVDIHRYIHLFKRNYKTILSVVVIVASIASIYAFKLPNIYRAETQILIQKESQSTPYTEFKGEEIGSAEGEHYNTEIEIIKSIDLLSKAASESNLVEPLLEVNNVKLSSDIPTHEKAKVAGEMIQGGLGIHRLRETRIFSISFKSTNPILCKEVANAVASAYVKQYIEQKLYVPKELLQYFPEDAQKIQAQMPYGDLQKLSKEEIARTLPSVVNDPLIRQLQAKAAETEAQLISLRGTYKEKHPKVVQAKDTLKFIQDRIRLETENIVRNLKTTLTSQLQMSAVRVLKEAEVPGSPIGPARFKIIIIAALASLVATCTIVFVMDYLDDTIKTQQDIEKFVQLPFLGHIPLFREKMKDVHQKAFNVHYDPLSEVSESFRFVKVAINFSGAPGTLKCLLLTSAVPSEGKSWTVSNLAASFLRDGEKVLIVDADLRHPTVHLLTSTDNLKGLSNYLTTNIDFSEVVQKTVIPQLDTVSAGPLSPNPTELFSSYRMENFIKEAKSKYDRIVIDSPPVSGLADSLVIGTKCDGVILLIQARRVSRNLIKKAKQRLLEMGVKVLGIVINKVDIEKDEPSYRYYAASYRYYGRQKKETGEKGKAAPST